MKIVKQTSKDPAAPSLREEQSRLTRQRIEDALVDLLNEAEEVDSITFKSVARKAGCTEMTVYRHFPSRDALLAGLWARLNREMGPNVKMPENAAELLAQHSQLFAGFDRLAASIMASLTTPQGREMRASLNATRRKAFLRIVREVAPRRDQAAAVRAASVLQLLHSAYAWASLREQWGLSGEEAGEATRWAIEALFKTLRREA